jgi:hypothetical protein
MKQSEHRITPPGAMFTWAYLTLMILLGLTGFGQMPIYSRYYMADIPGFAWLGQFMVTHFLHYLAAIALFSLTGYLVAGFLLQYRKYFRLTLSGWTSAVLIAGIMVTGLLLAARNLSGVILPPGFIILLDIAHLALVMLLMFKGLGAVLFGKKWTKPTHLI